MNYCFQKLLHQNKLKEIFKSIIENQKLTGLRDWLLRMLMNGRMKVN